MSRSKLLGGAGLAALILWLLAPQLFVRYASIRVKVVKDPIAAGGATLHVAIAAQPALAELPLPFALIVRVRNDTAIPQTIHVRLDGQERCAAEIAASTSQRIDCRVDAGWSGADAHEATLTATGAGFTLEGLEFATHFGALTPGPRNAIVAPAGAAGRHVPPGSVMLAALLAVLWMAVYSILARPPASTWLRRLQVALAALDAGIITLAVASPRVSSYVLLLDATFLLWLLIPVALPVLFPATVSVVRWAFRRSLRPVMVPLAVGATVCGLYTSFAWHRIDTLFGGNPSGPILIPESRFNANPIVMERQDLRSTLLLTDTNGYDGQFFYFMAFDPLLQAYRKHPRSYTRFIDAPPYRFGRIGFAWLTRLASFGRDTRYPVVMLTLVMIALGACGALLAVIARHHGYSGAYGLLVLAVPGFWQSAAYVLPEPIAIAFILGACICLLRARWVACGLLLAAAMLVRETSGALVLAIPATLALSGQWRRALGVALLAMMPVALWRLSVGSVFFPVYGLEAFMPHPDDVGWPLQGVWDLWRTIAAGRYWGDLPDMARAGVTFPLLTTAAAGIALTVAAIRPSPMAFAGVVYGLLTLTYNYRSVWLFVGNAQRLTIDLFIVLLLLPFASGPNRPVMPRALKLLWAASAIFLLFAAQEAPDVRMAFLGKFVQF